MKLISLYLLFAVLIQSLCYADVTMLSERAREVLQDSARFHEFHTTTNLPPEVVALCADENGRFAEPGQDWEATDFITEPTLPRKRLIWAAVADEYYVVHYERGGRAHSHHVLVATFTNGDTKSKVVWRGVGDQLNDYATFLDALRNGRLDDRREHAH